MIDPFLTRVLNRLDELSLDCGNELPPVEARTRKFDFACSNGYRGMVEHDESRVRLQIQDSSGLTPISLDYSEEDAASRDALMEWIKHLVAKARIDRVRRKEESVRRFFS